MSMILNQEKMSQVICLERSNLPLTPTALKPPSNSQLWCHFNPRSSVKSLEASIYYICCQARISYLYSRGVFLRPTPWQHPSSFQLQMLKQILYQASGIQQKFPSESFFFGRNWLSVGQTKQSRNSFQTSLEKNLLHFDPWLGGKGVESWRRNLAIFNKKKLLLYNSNAPTIHILSSVQDEPRNWMIVQAWRIVGEPSSPYIAYLYYSFLHLIQHTTPLLLSLICSHGICKEILNLYFFTNTRPLTLKSFLLRQKYFHKVLLAFTLYYCSVSVL